MNHSIYSADRATHLKVVVSVLPAGIAIVAITLTTRLTHPEIEIGVQKATAQTVYEARSNHALTEIVQREKHPI